jgi:putative membrane protein
MMFGYGSWPWMMVMPLLWIGLISAIVWAVVTLAKSPNDRSSGGGQPETPRQILDRRLASGAIDAATYTQTCEHLRNSAAS